MVQTDIRIFWEDLTQLSSTAENHSLEEDPCTYSIFYFKALEGLAAWGFMFLELLETAGYNFLEMQVNVQHWTLWLLGTYLILRDTYSMPGSLRIHVHRTIILEVQIDVHPCVGRLNTWQPETIFLQLFSLECLTTINHSCKHVEPTNLTYKSCRSNSEPRNSI